MSTPNEAEINIQSVMLAMRQVQQKSRAFIEDLARHDTLSQKHIMLLMDLKLTGSMRITEISDRFFITAGAATSMCDKLEEQNMIYRTRTTEDRRVVKVALTDTGEERLITLFKHLPSDKLHTIAHVFKQINELMSQITD